MADLSHFTQAAAHPHNYLETLATEGRKMVGYFCSYTPEEILLAADVHPVRLFGTDRDISLADAHLQAYCCSLVRGGLEDALAGRLHFLSGAVFPHTCDSIQRLSDIWRLNMNLDFFADVVLPVKLNTDSAREYMRDVLAGFRRDIEAWRGREITNEDLNRAIEIYNRLRGYLAQIYELRAEDPGLVSGRDVLALVKGAMIMDRSQLLTDLPDIIAQIETGRYRWDAGRAKRLLLVGDICDQPDIYSVLESAGGVVVADDLCTGSRWLEGHVDITGDPIADLADRYIRRPLCAAKHASVHYRADRVTELANRYRADGVLFLLLKFCDPHSFDYPFMKEALDRANIPNMLYEIEDQLPSEGQLATRFETFIDML
jgi:bcr-type benzoyl-CoA reductase subunit C